MMTREVEQAVSLLRAPQANSLRHKGVAIIMVIAVLTGLLALAAPFVLSMVLHGRTARGDMNAIQAQLGSEAATAHALAHLVKNVSRYDPTSNQLPLTTLSDLKVAMDFPAAGKGFEKLGVNLQSPRGQMWTAKVEDEQGKINLSTAPPALLGNLLGSAVLMEPVGQGSSALQVDDGSQFNPYGGSVHMTGERQVLHYSAVQGNVILLTQGPETPHLVGELVYDGRAKQILDYKFQGGGPKFTPFRSIYEIKMALAGNPVDALLPGEFARIERHLTVNSGMNGPLWGHAERPKEQGAISTDSFHVENGDGFTPGGLIRVVEAGIPQNYARVRWVNLNKTNNSANVQLDNPIGLDTRGSDRYIQPEMRHPINVNTASTEVLVACFKGICMTHSREPVRRQNAEMLADFIRSLKQPMIDADSLKEVLNQAMNKGIFSTPLRDAIFINATEPNSPKLRTTTVPFCFFSYGSYTIEGTGVVNGDNGLQLARQTTRQLLTMPTLWPGYFKIEWQAGFQKLLDQGMGAKVVTFPIAMGLNRNKRNQPGVRQPAEHSGGVRLDVGECGPHKNQNDPTEWIEHCVNEKDPGYRQDGYDMSKRDAFVLPLPQTGQLPTYKGLACVPTAVEMWYKPIRSGQCIFYDESLEEDRNRITFSYDPARGLVVQVFDAGYECQDARTNDWTHLRRKPVEIIYPQQLDGGEWYHVAASWKTGRPNGQEIRVDAQPKPQNEELKFRPGTRLAQALTLKDVDALELEEIEESNDYPKAGAVQIGEEIVEYLQRSGNTLQRLNRGARLSAAAKHDKGELVVPFGYSITLAGNLPIGGATLVERLERPADMRNCRIEVRKPPPNNFLMSTEVKEMQVTDCSDFPKSGFLLVGGELMYYARRDATKFLDLQRGLHSNNGGMPARNHNNGTGVHLASILISNSTNYERSGIVQIDDDRDQKIVEWLEYGDKQIMDGKHYLVSWIGNAGSGTYYTGPALPGQKNWPYGTPSAPFQPGVYMGGGFRNKFGICTRTSNRESAHEKKAKVIPVVQMSGPHCGHEYSPVGEQGVSEVSIVERGNTSGDLLYVKQAYIHQWENWVQVGVNINRWRWAGWAEEYYAGMNDFTSRFYPAHGTRVLKWPSGELPDAVGARRVVGADRGGEGKLSGYVDELKVNTFQSGGARIAMTTEGKGITAGDTDILLEEDDAWPRNGSGYTFNSNWPGAGGGGGRNAGGAGAQIAGGLVRIEDELLFYKTCSPEQFSYYSDVYGWLQEGDAIDGRPEHTKAGRQRHNPNNRNAPEPWPNNPPNAPEPLPQFAKTGLRLTGVIRGALGTKAVEHPVGAQALLLDGMAVSLLKGSLTRDTDTFSVANPAGFPNEGYAWVDNEVVSWLQKNNNSFTGCHNFHGRYGTTPADHDADSIVRCLPFRYWDREAKFYDGEGLAYVQSGYAANDAIWDGADFQISGTEERPRPNCCQPRVLVRFESNPDWSAEPTNRDGGLYEFRSKGNHVDLKGGGAGGGIRANQLEMRVYWEFRPGAFIPGSDWKRTFTIERMRATYYTPMVMRRLDEIERR